MVRNIASKEFPLQKPWPPSPRLAMDIVHEILRRPEIERDPPVLVDVGASGGLNSAWKKLAKYSVCVAFDPDEREMSATRKASSVYRELRVFNRAVGAAADPQAVFHLTTAPACSSLLRPNSQELANWEFCHRFNVVKEELTETIPLSRALDVVGVKRVDWFKTDSQGTDLRLFLSLGDSLIRNVLVAEFEPGIIDAYEGEDKLWNVLKSMDELGFWMSDMTIKGSSRIRKELVSELTRVEKDYMIHLHRASPGWAEVTYFNSMRSDDFTQRDYLLCWIFAFIRRQYGFSIEVASRAEKVFGDAIFTKLKDHSIQSFRFSYLNPTAYLPLFIRVLRKWKKLGSIRFLRSAESRSS